MKDVMAKRVDVVMENHGRGKVLVDGVELEGVISVECFAQVNKENVVSITRHEFVRADVVTFSGPAVVRDEKVTS